MTAPGEPPSIDRLTALLSDGDREGAVECLERLETAGADARKGTLRALRDHAEDEPATVAPVAPALAEFLTDDERAVRLTTARLLVALARSGPAAVLPAVEPLAEQLADDGAFYYVRARCAEALGYVALDHPDKVASPAVLADLRVGLAFDEPEVREKLAKALEHVALGDPERLRHQVDRLGEHLDDESELVRYHLASALVAIGCQYPERLAAVSEALVDRLDDQDENHYVRGRTAAALGLLARTDRDEPTALGATLEAVELDDTPQFTTDRVRFALDSVEGADHPDEPPAQVGSLAGVRATTDEAVDEITSPDGAPECPNCGLAIPPDAPPTCPRCGAPY